MLFVATCTDKPDSNPKRMEARPAHLAYLNGLGAKLKAGGALLSPDRKTVIGSLLIFEADDMAEVESMLAQDPYSHAGLFESVDIKPWRQAVGLANMMLSWPCAAMPSVSTSERCSSSPRRRSPRRSPPPAASRCRPSSGTPSGPAAATFRIRSGKETQMGSRTRRYQVPI